MDKVSARAVDHGQNENLKKIPLTCVGAVFAKIGFEKFTAQIHAMILHSTSLFSLGLLHSLSTPLY